MSTRTEVSSIGIGLGGAVFLIFLVLKLVGIEPVASWSWWWVTCPLWIPLAFVFGVIGICAIGAGLLALVCVGIDWWEARK